MCRAAPHNPPHQEQADAIARGVPTLPTLIYILVLCRKLNNRQSARRSYQRRRDRAQRLEQENKELRGALLQAKTLQAVRQQLDNAATTIPAAALAASAALPAAALGAHGIHAAQQPPPQQQPAAAAAAAAASAAPAAESKGGDTPPSRRTTRPAAAMPQPTHAAQSTVPADDPNGTHLAVQTQMGSVSTYRFAPGSKHPAFNNPSPAFTPPVDGPVDGTQPNQATVQYFPWAHVREGPNFTGMPWQSPQWLAAQQHQIAQQQQMLAQHQLAAQQQLATHQQLRQAQLVQQQLVQQHYLTQQAKKTTAQRQSAPAARSAAPSKRAMPKAKPSIAKAEARTRDSRPRGAKQAPAAAAPVLAAAAQGPALAGAGQPAAVGQPAAAEQAPPPRNSSNSKLLPFETDLDLLQLNGFEFGENSDDMQLGWSDEVFSLGEPVFN